MFLFKTTTVHESWDAIAEMTKRHHAEVNLFNIDLDVAVERYKQLTEGGSYQLFIIELEETSEVVGYAGFFLNSHTHHRTSIHAHLDVLFIEQDYRGGTGKEFFKFCEDCLKEIDVSVVHVGVPLINDWSKMIKAIGYEPLEVIYKRRL